MTSIANNTNVFSNEEDIVNFIESLNLQDDICMFHCFEDVIPKQVLFAQRLYRSWKKYAHQSTAFLPHFVSTGLIMFDECEATGLEHDLLQGDLLKLKYKQTEMTFLVYNVMEQITNSIVTCAPTFILIPLYSSVPQILEMLNIQVQTVYSSFASLQYEQHEKNEYKKGGVQHRHQKIHASGVPTFDSRDQEPYEILTRLAEFLVDAARKNKILFLETDFAGTLFKEPYLEKYYVGSEVFDRVTSEWDPSLETFFIVYLT
jgi:hypothetical protein